MPKTSASGVRTTRVKKKTSNPALRKIIEEAEVEARAYLPESPKGSRPTAWTKTDITVVKADGTRTLVPDAALERVEPFYPDQVAARIPRDALLTPIPTDAAVRLDKYWRSFPVPKERLPHGTNFRLAMNLLGLCLLFRKDRKLTASQRAVVSYNIGVVRMMLRMYSDQKTLIN